MDYYKERNAAKDSTNQEISQNYGTNGIIEQAEIQYNAGEPGEAILRNGVFIYHK